MIQPTLMEKIWFLFFVPLLLPRCLAMTVTNLTTDQYALLAFKAHITFDSRNILAHNWSTNTSCCSWIGVTCGAHHRRVTALNLPNMGLTGTIPPHLGNLSFLSSLNIGNNSFHGHLPVELSFLRRMKVIDLGLNNFNGDVPFWFGVFTKLQRLILFNNSFSGTIPTSLCNISKLETLYLFSNQLHGSIPKEIGNLTSLKNLSMAVNQLSGSIPSSIFNISSLRFLYLNLNNLSGSLPDDMCNHLPELQVLYLSRNQFYGQIPSTIYKCSRLQQFSLYENKFTGSIPTQIGNLTKLKTLHLGDNNLKGAIPHEMGNLRNLESLHLYFNGLTGPIPSKIFNISTMEVLSLVRNHLTGQLPSRIGLWLPNLQGLFLWGNKLSGVIPSSISNASKLTNLQLSDNLFNGFIPNTLGNLRFLERLNVANNILTTEPFASEMKFLTSLTDCKYLSRLVLSINPLDGILPISIGNLSTSLQYFYADDCKIKGSIPKEIGNLSNLLTLSLGNNELSGSIPTTLGRLRQLQGLTLPHNRLQGFIPYDLCSLRSMVDLLLNGNKLSGSISACMGNLTSLLHLYLDSNKLTSIIPSTLWSLTDILELNLSTNSLSGYLPLDIGNLKVLTQLDFSRNQLSGEIPNTIGGLQNLVNLSLASNRLQGSIPQSFGSLISLELLDLSNNNLSGLIPKSLQVLLHLKYLNVSFNRLEGEIPNGGPFSNFTAQSFMMNDAFCGAPRLQVPPCKMATLPRSRITIVLLLEYISIAIALMVLVVLPLILVLIKCRKKRVKFTTQVDLSLEPQRRMSYHELLQATHGFCESNLLGIGSFGSVYKGILSNEVNVVIKVFNLQLEGAFKSFDVECEVLCNIRHRNLIKIISTCANIDFKALVLEYMPNGSLEKWLYSHNYCLDILQRLNIMIDVASALEYLHHGYSTSIAHCDLKPNNVLLDEDMVAHVSDFGISKLLGEEETKAQTKTLATIGYMAPEFGSEGIVSTKGDVYSYGILLMETFTRKKPTNEMFVGEMSLKRWVEDSLPLAVIEVVDANLLKRDEEHFSAKNDCISSILELALHCSMELPEERIDIKNVVATLNKIRTKFQMSVVGTQNVGFSGVVEYPCHLPQMVAEAVLANHAKLLSFRG